MKEKEFKIYVSKVFQVGIFNKEDEGRRIILVKTSFSNQKLVIELTDDMVKDDSVFIKKVESVMGVFFAKFLDENNDKMKYHIGHFDVSYYFNHEYSASGNSRWSYQSLVNDYLTIATSLDLSLPLSEREILLFSRGAQKYFSR